MRRDAWVIIWLWVVGYLFWPLRQVRRWYLRLRLRRRMRSLGMIPCLAMLWCSAEVSHLAAQSIHAQPDSLLGTVLSRNVIGDWKQGTLAIYCLTWVATLEDRPNILVIIDAQVADPNKDPLCPNPKGGFYPLWVDADRCPPGRKSPLPEREWLIIRCSETDISRYWRDLPQSQRAQ